MSDSNNAEVQTPEQQFKAALQQLLADMKKEARHPLRNLHAKEADSSQSSAYRDMATCVRLGSNVGIPPGVILALFAVRMDDVPINPIYNKATIAITWNEVMEKIREFTNYTPKHIANVFSQGLVVKS